MPIDTTFVPGSGIYLLSHSVGRLPANAREALNTHFFEPWESGLADVWPSWIQGIDLFREALGRLFNAETGEFCPQTNLSSGLTKLLYSQPPRTGKNTLLLSEQDFPSMAFVLECATRSGFKIKFIPADADLCDANTWDQFLTDDIHLALLTHVLSNTSQQIPVAEITRMTRAREIISVVDIAQSSGILPIDLQEWQADFMLGSCVKWLCGGPGAGYLWADPQTVSHCKPVDVGWFSHQDPFEFDIHHFEYAAGVNRFWGGTPSVMPFVLAANSINTIIELGTEQIRAHNLLLTQRVIDTLPEPLLVSPHEPDKRGGTLVLNFGERQTQIAERLNEAQIRFDIRATGIRLSPHIYNSMDEMEILLGCLTE